ncbi:MAG: helicase-associated domain-containing protein [Planctomycetes bacterium]|nr:helicase-associated domain-containing protein [Planctomycetota bacterium]
MSETPQSQLPTGEPPLIVQADGAVLLETQHPAYEMARDRLARFAELEKSPEYVHFYRITPISIWNAAALGESVDAVVPWLRDNARFPVAREVTERITEWFRRYGLLRLEKVRGNGAADALTLVSDDHELLQELVERPQLEALVEIDAQGRALVTAADRGAVKQALVRLGYPVEDRAGYRQGDTLAFGLGAAGFALRDYQRAAAAAFHQSGSDLGGCGVVVLPCGAGKTVVGIAAMQLLQTNTLVLTTNTVAVRQWVREILDKTDLLPEQVGEYTGENKQIRPITVATYQILTHRKAKLDQFTHLDLFDKGGFGLIVYDEVHLLPAPVFRATAGIQARRRLGLTATLVREDGRADEVFSLIGPKRFEVPWKQLESAGFLAEAQCHEVRVPLGEARSDRYAAASARTQIRIAADNERKEDVVGALLRLHGNDRVLVIGQYLEQLQHLATVFRLPLVTGQTPNQERERLYAAFRRGELPRLIVSKVGNFAIDLPDANVAIQVSGTFGSRQEEAQRLGRVLRPKSDGSVARFYTLVSADTREQEFARKRQLFLTEQGYAYAIVAAAEVLRGEARGRRSPREPAQSSRAAARRHRRGGPGVPAALARRLRRAPGRREAEPRRRQLGDGGRSPGPAPHRHPAAQAAGPAGGVLRRTGVGARGARAVRRARPQLQEPLRPRGGARGAAARGFPVADQGQALGLVREPVLGGARRARRVCARVPQAAAAPAAGLADAAGAPRCPLLPGARREPRRQGQRQERRRQERRQQGGRGAEGRRPRPQDLQALHHGRRDGSAPAEAAAAGAQAGRRDVDQHGGIAAWDELIESVELHKPPDVDFLGKSIEEAMLGTACSLDLAPLGIQPAERAVVIFHEVALHSIRRRGIECRPQVGEELVCGGDFASNVSRFLRELQQNKVLFTADGDLFKASQKRIAGMLLPVPGGFLAPEQLLEVLYRFCLQRRLIDRRGERSLRPTPAGLEFERASLADQVKMLLGHFVEDRSLPGEAYHQTRMRRVLLRLLRRAEPMLWQDVSVLPFLSRNAYLAQLEAQPTEEFFAARFQGGGYTPTESLQQMCWNLLIWIKKRLFPLGLVDIGLHGGRVTALRLSRLGAELLDADPAGKVGGTRSSVIVQPDFEVLVFPGDDVHDVVHQIDRFAHRTKSDHVHQFRIDEDSVRAGVADGLSAAQIVQELTDRARVPIPQNVLYSLEEWAQNPRAETRRRAVAPDPPAPRFLFTRTRRLPMVLLCCRTSLARHACQ